MVQPSFIVVDLFCGAGGVSTGFELSGVAKVIACVNHDHNAIMSHWANYPEVQHYEEDIRTLELSPLVALVAAKRAEFPSAKLILWASLECTNFSKAKGGLARDADSRTLADHLNRYIVVICPDYVMTENVVEFLEWGPTQVKVKDGLNVRIKNKHGDMVDGHEPIRELRGTDFVRWCSEIDALGYRNEWRKLNSADYGAFTSRERLFGCFAKDGLPIVWPPTTHHKKGANDLPKWNAVKYKIDFSDDGYSIFYRGRNPAIPARRRKDLSEATLERVYAGCIKHIAGGKQAFMTKYHGGAPRTNDLEKPLTVIDTQNRHAVVNASFISKCYSGAPWSKNISVDGPAGTITTIDGQALVQAGFLSTYHGNGDNTHSLNAAHPAVCAADVHAVAFMHRDFSTPTNSSIDVPAGALTNVPKMNVVQGSFIDSGNFTNVPVSTDEPCPTIMACRKYPYLISLQYGGHMSSVESPAPTILATSAKTPIYLVVTETGSVAIQVYKDDSPIIVKLKEFMALYGIVDITMRMLRVDELLSIQGFPKTYRLFGTQANQKKFIGNSVTPDVVKCWALAMSDQFSVKNLA